MSPAERGDGSGGATELRLPLARLLHNWKDAHRRAVAYLEALGIPAGERTRVADDAVVEATADAEGEESFSSHASTLARIRARVQRDHPPAGGTRYAADGFPDWRLRVALQGRLDPDPNDAASPRWQEDGEFRSMPPIARRSMRPHHLKRVHLRRHLIPTRAECADDGLPPDENGQPDRRPVGRQRRSRDWYWVALRRRILLLVLILLPSLVASSFMVEVLPHQGRTWLEVAIALFFGALFGWISIGFWTACLGFVILLKGRDRFAIRGPSDEPIAPDCLANAGRTAIIMPICEEPVDRIFAGLRTIYRSLERTGTLDSFDFFVLSDTADPSLWVHEEAAWFDWCRAFNGFGRIFYRRRRVRMQRKSGNVADFCRRWGRNYRYMIVLDADSVMSGEALVRLVQMIERRPRAAMVQTVPCSIGRRSLFARAQQFASRAYGPMFSAGLHFWQLGDGQYWGHNAIIRIAPFMEHCDLPRLPGKPPLGGEILSHDFVEAALLGRAGWELWLAYDLPGSWEDTSSSLLEEMKRDRRWCQGNLQHLRLFTMGGLVGAHRALFLNGVLSYVSALLWFCFLFLSTSEAIWEAVREPNYFPSGPSLFPEWPVWRPDWALSLAGVTAAILFLPKVLSVLLILVRGPGARAFGGFFRLIGSVLLEILLSSLFAPIRMVFHTRFVITNLLGYTVTWKSSERDDTETAWKEALRHHAVDTFVAALWGIGVYALSPGYFWWLTPIVFALILSVPTSVIASRIKVGDRIRRWGLLSTPDETNPARELLELREEIDAAARRRTHLPPLERDGFVRVAVDPYVNAIHRALLGPPRRVRPEIRARRNDLLERAIAEGPQALDAKERKALLYDPTWTTELHRKIWGIRTFGKAERWGRPQS